RRAPHYVPTHFPSLSLSSSSIRRPPTPPLFPYTTLFRSVVTDRPEEEQHALAAAKLRRAKHVHPLLAVAPSGGADDHRAGNRIADRKSTRLNSSHVKISYAVFCLKKKKKNTKTVTKRVRK